MAAGTLENFDNFNDIVLEAGLALGERKNTFSNYKLNIPKEKVTYLKGVGFAVELEIMSKCDLLILMPSGFAESLWMKQRQPVVMVFPPIEYLLRLYKHRMPFFSNLSIIEKMLNIPIFHFHEILMMRIKRSLMQPIEK